MTTPSITRTTRNTQPQSTRESVPLALWPVAQVSAQHQRAGRYLPDCTTHPGEIVPELARRIVAEYSRPGDLVVDPVAGIGTTLVEAAALGRRAVGIELEVRWLDLAAANVEHVLSPEDRSLVELRLGNETALGEIVGDLAGRVDLICTSPPHGVDAAVYAGCLALLRPGGLLVTVTKNSHRNGSLFDFAGTTVALARSVGFGYRQHVVAFHAAICDGDLVARPSDRELTQLRHAHAAGEPTHLVVHEDVCVFEKPVEKENHLAH
jgi:SAM-dependent methyltransferase